MSSVPFATQVKIPAAYIRGGKSKDVFFRLLGSNRSHASTRDGTRQTVHGLD